MKVEGLSCLLDERGWAWLGVGAKGRHRVPVYVFFLHYWDSLLMSGLGVVCNSPLNDPGVTALVL